MAVKQMDESGGFTSRLIYTPPPREIIPFMPEQVAVIESTQPVIKVRAGAGAGKTTTLTGYAEYRPDASILYVAFNKAIAEEASSKFTPNVICKTTHSIAYNAMNVRQQYGHKLTASVRAKQVSDVMGVPFYAATLALNTINAFLYSSDKYISENHAIRALVKPSIQQMVVEIANTVWKKMTDPYDKTIGLTHDGYLKLFHLSGKSMGGYDIVMMDEAQDANPVTSAMVNMQKCGKVFVGDRNQSIYAFRGAENAMDLIEAREYLLSSSFRFGQSVADIANVLLENTLGDDIRMKGLGKPSSINGKHPDGRYALLARTNGTLIEAAAHGASNGKKVAIVGGVESLKLSMIMDTFKLFCGEPIENIATPAVKQFKDFNEMEELVSDENAGDLELASLCKAVRKFGDKTPDLINLISGRCQHNIKAADIVLSTAHKSKGLEFDSVQLADDFRDPNHEEGIEIQEGNLLYVAATRAKRNLVLNESMNAFIAAPKKNAILKQELVRKFTRLT